MVGHLQATRLLACSTPKRAGARQQLALRYCSTRRAPSPHWHWLWRVDDRIWIPAARLDLHVRLCVAAHAGAACHRGREASQNDFNGQQHGLLACSTPARAGLRQQLALRYCSTRRATSNWYNATAAALSRLGGVALRHGVLSCRGFRARLGAVGSAPLACRLAEASEHGVLPSERVLPRFSACAIAYSVSYSVVFLLNSPA
jgi:hypothetical protein